MFAKKPSPESKMPSLPPLLVISGPMDPPQYIRPVAPPPIVDAPPEPLERISQHPPHHRIAEMVIAQAFREGASQITLTPRESANAVQYLKADTWHDTMSIPLEISSGLVSAFKTLAGLPIWEHRMELHGLIPVHCPLGDYDVQISIMPTRHGEKVVMRIKALFE